MTRSDRKPLPPPDPDPLAELRAKGLVRTGARPRYRGPTEKIVPRGGTVTEFIKEQRG